MYGNMYQSNLMMPQMASQSITRVNGIDGAKAFQLGANSTIALFDSNADIFYVKSTDCAGFPTIRIFKFEEMMQDAPASNYVSREEMEEYVKHIIQEQSADK